MSNILKVLLFLLALAVVGYFVITPQKSEQPPLENTDISVQHDDTFSYLCSEDNTVITTTFGDNATLEITIDDTNYTLAQTISASGARYANFDESVVFWNKGVTGMLQINGETIYENCILVEESTLPKQPTETSIDEKLSAVDWSWIETLYSDDSVVSAEKGGSFVARFDTNGHFSSQTDCNTIVGSYTLGEHNSLSFTPLASTLMACIDSQEDIYGTMLSQVQSYLFTEDGKLALVLAYDSGSMIFEAISKPKTAE